MPATNDILEIAAAAAAGLALGAFYFGGLWWTVRRLPGARHPAVLLLASFLLRGTVLVAGVLAASGGRWRRVAACLAGLLLVRLAAGLRLHAPAPTARAGVTFGRYRHGIDA